VVVEKLSQEDTKEATDAIKSESNLTTETVEGTSLSLPSIDDIEGGNGLALGVLGVGNGVTDDRLEE
jgi:hypothetical protein